MTAAAFDTLKFSRSLRDKANLPADQAKGFAEAFAGAIQADLARRTDLRETEMRLDAELREIELRLKAEIERSKAETVRWVVGSIGIQTVVVVGSILAFARAL